MNATTILSDLNQFSGSEQFFKHGVNHKLVYTEGVQYLAQQAKCYWLIDEIACVLFPQLLKKYNDGFYSIRLLVTNSTGVITVDDGNGNVHINHKINWTDFPISGKPVQFFLCESDKYYCLMLPGEY
jgi:hypothetical protein